MPSHAVNKSPGSAQHSVPARKAAEPLSPALIRWFPGEKFAGIAEIGDHVR
ncbi:hypothetical protein [Amycolatopsis sp. cmx-11-32]|uniref:hypothetical protein n=1 Tax=Amycolatopsis sp. cmx-11-32 TaxID=2785796 RepID=UPI0039E5F2ED